MLTSSIHGLSLLSSIMSKPNSSWQLWLCGGRIGEANQCSLAALTHHPRLYTCPPSLQAMH